MPVKSKINIYKNMSKTELEREISKYVIHYRYYQRLMVIKMIVDGYSITDAANEIKKAYPTVHRWVSTCSEEGLEGLKPSFGGGGHNAKLSKNELNEIENIIVKNPKISLKDLTKTINKKFNVEYTSKQTRVIAGKLGYDYRSKKPRFYRTPTSNKQLI